MITKVKPINEFDWTIKPIRKGYNYYQGVDILDRDITIVTVNGSFQLEKTINISASDDCREEQEFNGNAEEQLQELGIDKKDIIEIVVNETHYTDEGDNFETIIYR
jgi:hypothetical protein